MTQMHPYSVWLKLVLNSLIKDLRYSSCSLKEHHKCVQLFLDITNIIKIEINNESINLELERLIDKIKTSTENEHGENTTKDKLKDLKLSDGISIYLGTLVYETEKLSSVFSKCKEIMSDTKYSTLETKKCFGSRALTGLMSVESVGSSEDAYYIMTKAKHIDNEDYKIQLNPDDEISLDDNQTDESPDNSNNDPIIRAWKPAAIIFIVLSLSFSYLIHKLELASVNYSDAAVTALLIATAVWFFFNPKTRYFRMFAFLLSVFFAGRGFAYTINAGHYEPESQLVISITNAATDWVMQIIVGVISVVLLVLDYLERKHS